MLLTGPSLCSVPTAEQLEALGKKRKRKPLKINPDAASGNKTVFDDEGDACHPLEALAKSFAVRFTLYHACCALVFALELFADASALYLCLKCTTRLLH